MKEELTDTQIALIVKLALDFNAGIIARVAPFYGQEVKPERRKQLGKDLVKFCDDYNDATKAVLIGEQPE